MAGARGRASSFFLLFGGAAALHFLFYATAIIDPAERNVLYGAQEVPFHSRLVNHVCIILSIILCGAIGARDGDASQRVGLSNGWCSWPRKLCRELRSEISGRDGVSAVAAQRVACIASADG
eukprot:TRINITY_DN5639_c0_g1_i14.p1 TRINITY_DN5639_c0_g1~~TRINITY_DN5639_c0_g1_i14.p1  ORF type:complete len:122 (-),score=5.42 TRINITY_DN5639_c0_g1_i14:41-406(-)